MARRKKGRAISGVLLLDKPQGLSSNAALQKVKRLFNAQKAGHTGALDPLATGMLPLCFGEATKFSQFLLESDKGYRVIGKLGIRTDSCDSTGEVIEKKEVKVSKKQLEKGLQQFRGDIMQIPSMFSALKRQARSSVHGASTLANPPQMKCAVHAKGPSRKRAAQQIRVR